MRDLKATRPRGVGEPARTAAPAAAGLLILDEPGQPAREFALRPGSTYLAGRGSRCDVMVQHDEEVSRTHGSIQWNAGGWTYRDLNSASGSFVDGVRLEGERILSPGLVVWLGTRTKLHAVGPASDGVAVSREQDFRSPAWESLRTSVEKAGRRSQAVLLIGPSGAGKTTHAREIHELSKLQARTTLVAGEFIAVNSASLPNDAVWLGSFFNGHQRGAFTGAADREGILAAVANGTLFLDEIESLPPVAQGFLLDILDRQGNAAQLGSHGRERVEVPRFRLMSATKVPLAKSTLRSDLVQRLLDGMQIVVPSLKDRREDLPAYLSTFTRNYSVARGKAVTFTARAIAALSSYPWPGEVRELRAVAHLLLTEATERSQEDGALVITEEDVHAVLLARVQAFGEANVEVARPKTARALTREDVVSALDRHNGNIEQTAKALGIARNTLKARLVQYGLREENR